MTPATPNRPAEWSPRSRWRDCLTHIDGRPYLTRWFLFDKRTMPWTPRLHRFHSGDADVPHDHPSDFWAITLWGSATEVIYELTSDRRLIEARRHPVLPFIPRFTRGNTIHRIIDPKRMYTFVIFKKYQRQWGFWPTDECGKAKWVRHTEFKRGRIAAQQEDEAS